MTNTQQIDSETANELLAALELLSSFMAANIHGYAELDALKVADAAILKAKGH